tara:strand:+ start:44 stop:916 length:873 start_codon:yes stop_codon:yes gene_type:complete
MKDFLYHYSENVYSQHGEDGINKTLFDYLNIKEGYMLEIGAWDGFYLSNTANLWSKNKNYKSILIEPFLNQKESPPVPRLNKEKLELEYKNIECFIEAASLENTLESIINKSKFDVTDENFILASIDIDGDDLNVTRSLGKYKPIILIVESNGGIYKGKYHNQGGSTVQELVNFGVEIGYELIGQSGDLYDEPGNLYFIRNDFKSKFEICKNHWTERGLLLENGIPIEKQLEKLSLEKKYKEKRERKEKVLSRLKKLERGGPLKQRVEIIETILRQNPIINFEKYAKMEK